ncbi:MAG: hypothetical protein KDD52_02900 [Bdellovibrionales bacterium]|nr:hypothetical protein [Bdellovibrionales bacterium]
MAKKSFQPGIASLPQFLYPFLGPMIKSPSSIMPNRATTTLAGSKGRWSAKTQKAASVSTVLAILALQGIAALVLVPKGLEYFREQKAQEALEIMREIFDLEVDYYRNQKKSPPLNGQISFLPLPPEPAIPMSQPQQGHFSNGPWATLGFSSGKPLYYSYSVHTQGSNLLAEFTVKAQGDLDGDGQFSLYEMTGRINSEGRVEGDTTVFVLDGLE